MKPDQQSQSQWTSNFQNHQYHTCSKNVSIKELVQAMLMAQTPFSVVSSSSGRAYTDRYNVINISNKSSPCTLHSMHSSEWQVKWKMENHNIIFTVTFLPMLRIFHLQQWTWKIQSQRIKHGISLCSTFWHLKPTTDRKFCTNSWNCETIRPTRFFPLVLIKHHCHYVFLHTHNTQRSISNEQYVAGVDRQQRLTGSCIVSTASAALIYCRLGINIV